MDEIPEKMIERQLNDTRYISKFVSQLLSNIVRIDDEKAKKIIEKAEILANQESNNKKADEIRRKAKSEASDEGVNSKNIIPGNGKITGRLKQDWGLNDLWNNLILPRFDRMNELWKAGKEAQLEKELDEKKKKLEKNKSISDDDRSNQISHLEDNCKKAIRELFATDFFISKNTNNKTIPTIPLELSKGFQKKRIDHRHHALDALVIACATRDHINLLNNKHAKSKNERYDLQHKLRHTGKWKDNNGKERDKFTEFKKPWSDFTVDAKNELEKIVVSFKQNLRVINKATNHYEKIINGKKTKVEQKGVNWAIRKPMHKETVSGLVDLPRIKVPKGKILTATRKLLDTSFNEKTILSITDTGIQKILLNYLKVKGSPELAFSPEGIEEMNQNISLYNDGKPHQPILKIRVFEVGSKFQVGYKGNKKDKYVEAAKGTNLFFGIYEDKDGKRSYDAIPLNIVIERQKQGLPSVPEFNEKEHRLLFSLSPNDLVYVPNEDENEIINIKDIYKVVSFSGSQMFCVRQDVATSIVNKQEFSSLNKMERSIEGTMIKEVCIKLKVDRLGNISQA